MSDAPPGASAGQGHRIERLHPWIAGLLTALLHLAYVLIVLLAPPITLTMPDGDDAAGGSRVEVRFIGESPPAPTPDPDDQPAPASDPTEASAAASRLRTTPAPRSPDPLPPEAHIVSEGPSAARRPRPVPAAPPSAPRPPPSGRRPGHTWGQPPGMAVQDLAPVNAGPAPSPAPARGQRASRAADAPSLEVGGYQVIYQLASETRLRAWREQGMTEIFIPLPGTRKLMVCPLETALKRESGPCRQLDPDDPELSAIGDAREVIGVRQVYRQGELVWRGPGAYR